MRQPQKANRKLLFLMLREQLSLVSQAIPALWFPAALAVVIIGGSLWLYIRQDNDVKDAPLQAGTALVTQMQSVPDKRGFSMNLTFRVGKSDVLVNVGNDERLIWTQVGDMVPVTYQVGKSGATYIKNWQAPPHKVSLPR